MWHIRAKDAETYVYLFDRLGAHTDEIIQILEEGKAFELGK